MLNNNNINVAMSLVAKNGDFNHKIDTQFSLIFIGNFWNIIQKDGTYEKGFRDLRLIYTKRQ